MQLLFSASNALNKWLKSDLPRLPHEEGKQAGVNSLQSDSVRVSWQVQIIDNEYQSKQKTIIATEAYSRFTVFLAADRPLTVEALSAQLTMQWQSLLAEMLSARLITNGDIAHLLSQLENIPFSIKWVKNTDRSINGHITDASLWLTQTLREHKLSRLPDVLAQDLACHLNNQEKRIKNRKDKFIPIERFLIYCREICKAHENI
ncbi:MAG: amino acid adenylation [Pseudoalteromonas tetraodonis]|nr:amino acid adenylation [Pseudoalteromonas tetraodonis]